jgi:hypothetical protein
MFMGCKLNAASVKNIADTIKNINGISLTAADGKITIHVDTTMSDKDKSLVLSYFNTAKASLMRVNAFTRFSSEVA